MMHSRLLLLILVLFQTVKLGESFASWLKCYIELDEEEVIMNYSVIPAERAPKAFVEVKLEGDSEWTRELSYPAGETTAIEARLVVPKDLEGLDIQFVMEVTEGAAFDKAVFCEGVRTTGRSLDDWGHLVIDGSTASVDVYAGWASGHEPVKLTARTTLKRIENEEEL